MRVAMKAAMASMVLLAVSASGVNAGVGSGQITFQGEILDSACSINPGSSDQTVSLGQVAKSQLETGGMAPPQSFQIELSGCSLTGLTDKTVTAKFTGAESAAVPGALGIVGTAKGAGIMLVDGTGTAVTLGSSTKVQTIQAGDNTMLFGAYLKGQATGAITPGEFTSVTNFALEYK